jgi:hypothetical protein
MCPVIYGDENEDGEPGDVARLGEHAVNKHKTATLAQRMKTFDFRLFFIIISFR